MGIGAPFTIASTATRHMLDANVTFGQSSERFNARDRYRRTYTDGQRVGAGVGTALGVALPVTAGLAWAQRGMKIPGISGHAEALATGLSRANPRGLSPAAIQNVGRVAGVAALGLAAGVGVKKTIDITRDDGHLGAVGTASGIVAGTVAGLKVGQRFAGRYAPLVSGAGAILGGIGGHLGGKAIRVGESQIGKENVQAPRVDDGALDRVRSFALGGYNHLNEVGPTTQGISLGYSWGMREAVQKRYSNAERAGAMHGDLAAAGIMGGGALAVVGGLTGASRHAGKGTSGIKAGATIAGQVLARGPVTGMIQQLGQKGALGVGAAAAGIAGVTTWKAYQGDSETWGKGAATGIAAGTLAATAGTAALISRSSALQGVAAAPKAASSALAAAALIGVLSTMRMPLQQFMNDARDSTAANGGVDWKKAGPVGGLAAAGGGVGAYKVMSRILANVPDGTKWKGIPIKPVALVAGTAIGTATAAGIGVGLSSTMPDLKTIGISAAGGAAAGAAFGGFARGLGVVPGMIGGAALGISASSLLRDDTPAADAPTPQDAAGTVAG